MSLNALIKRLSKDYSNAECSLSYQNPFQLLVATILSAQCTDERVNKVTPALFKKFPDPLRLGNAPIEDIEKLIQSTGFFRNKAKNLKEMARNLAERFRSEVPQSLDQLVLLPGVGRKTANVVLGNAFGKPEGIVVDTHVMRLSQRLGLSRNKTPEKIELDLNKLIPEKYWVVFPHWLILHGRKICQARNPRCQECPLEDLCPKKGIEKGPKNRSVKPKA